MSWQVPKIDEKKAVALSKELGITPALARILIFKGYASKENASRFIHPEFKHLRDPFNFPDMLKAVDRILQVISDREKIRIWGHDDTDGITATAVLFQTIRNMGGAVDWYIPASKVEGYGITEKGLQTAVSEDVSLIITVDCGSSTLDLPAQPDIIVTDHHEIIKGILNAFAFINPKQDYPFSDLAGVSVAYKLAQAVAMKKMKISTDQWFSVTPNLLPLVTIGTIADKVELIDENRIFVKKGSKEIKNSPFKQVGIDEIIKLLGAVSSSIPNLGVEFLLYGDEKIVLQLRGVRRERDIQIEATYRNCLEFTESFEGIIIVYEQDLDPGVGGICATRLVNKEGLPAVIISQRPDGLLVGESRGPEGFDLIDLFASMDDLFIDWGGHKRAAGFLMEAQRLEQFKTRAAGYAGKHLPTLTQKQTVVDAEIKPEEIKPTFLQEIELLEPFGPGNPRPILLTRGVHEGLPATSHFDNLPDYECNVLWTVVNGRPEIKGFNKTDT